MSYQCLDFSITNKVAHLILNRYAAKNTLHTVL